MPEEKMYIECCNCGEVFDSIDAANGEDHRNNGEDGEGNPCFDDRHTPLFGLRTESEAF